MKHIHECLRCGIKYIEDDNETEACESSYEKTCQKCYDELNPEDPNDH